VLDYLDIARADGARCVLGGNPANGPGLGAGQFVEPTIFVDVRNDMRIAQEEVFGPILSVIEFTDEQEAVTLTNEIRYGLVAGVWTTDIGRALRMSKALHVETVWVNTYRTYSYMVPFGGTKQVRTRTRTRHRGHRRIPRDQKRRHLHRRRATGQPIRHALTIHGQRVTRRPHRIDVSNQLSYPR
jgi:acyl-CoA reductase-like NAD-dependent aldehyde dehydrogenase